MTPSQSLLKSALADAARGRGMTPEICERLVALGWVEWVDYELGTPINLDHPRSFLRITTSGRAQLEGAHPA